MHDNETVIYTKPGCPYCAAAMEDFRSRKIAFTEVDVQNDLEARHKMVALSGGLRVPTIVQPDGKVSVGFDGF